MSTRCMIEFKHSGESHLIYQHWDGYPEHTEPKLKEFLKWNKSRNNDLSYSVANFILWAKLNDHVLMSHDDEPKSIKAILNEPNTNDDMHTGYGILKNANMYGIEYHYIVNLETLEIEIK